MCLKVLKLYGDGDNTGRYQAVLLRLNLALLMSGGAMIQDVFIRMRAKQLYWQGYTPADIAQLMGINQNTIYSWKKRDEWDATPPIQRVTQSIDARLIQLTAKPDKSGGDFKEIDLLTRQLKKLNDGQGEQAVSGKKPRRRKLKNHFTEEQIVALREKILPSLAWHQREWYDNRHHRNRMILKSRQIGATWYFAREALLDALRDDVSAGYQRNLSLYGEHLLQRPCHLNVALQHCFVIWLKCHF